MECIQCIINAATLHKKNILLAIALICLLMAAVSLHTELKLLHQNIRAHHSRINTLRDYNHLLDKNQRKLIKELRKNNCID